MLRLLFGAILTLSALPGWCGSPNDSPQDLMRALYQAHNEGEGKLLDPAAHDLRAIYFTAALTNALDQELNRNNPDEVGNLDFDPFFYAQDMEIHDLDFAVAKVSGTSTIATARFRNFTEVVEIAYRVVQDAQGWRIDDVIYADGASLRQLLATE
jgi:hypothetical protein